MHIAEVMLPVPTECEECGEELEDVGYVELEENSYNVKSVLCYDCIAHEPDISENWEIREAVKRYLGVNTFRELLDIFDF